MKLRAFPDWARLLWASPWPFFWLAAAYAGWLAPLEFLTVDWRFQVRGPIDSQAKVFYVNRDRPTSQYLGQDYFPRAYYAEAIEALMEVGQARAVFLDFVLSEFTHRSGSLALDRWNEGNLALEETLLKHPDKVVLAAAYTGVQQPYWERPALLPVMGMDPDRHPLQVYDPVTNPAPELPQFPFWAPHTTIGYDNILPRGRVGLIDHFGPHLLDGGGAQVRFVPAFVEVANGAPSLHLANSVRDFHAALQPEADLKLVSTAGRGGIPPKHIVIGPDGFRSVPAELEVTFHAAAIELLLAGRSGTQVERRPGALQILDENGSRRFRIPLRGGQALAVNYYSGWHSPDAEEARHGDVERFMAEEDAGGFEYALISDVERDPAAWIERVEAGDPAATRFIATWSRVYDRRNPKVSLVDLLVMHRAYKQAIAMGASRAAAFIAGTFGVFQDHYILIGPTDPILQDLGPTPFDRSAPRVAVHGNLLKTIVDENFLRFSPGWFLPVATMVLSVGIGLLLVPSGRWSRLSRVGAVLIVFAYGAVAFIAFRQAHWVLPLVAPLGAAVSTGMTVALLQLAFEEKQRSRIKGMFGSYVSPELVHQMVESRTEPRLGGHNAEITAFFSDIQSFSSFSEHLPPARLVRLMNEYLDAMTAILDEEQGTLDKYIGDAIVAIFGAPVALSDHAWRACRAAARIQERQAELRRRWQRDAEQWPPIVEHMRTRIGLNSGEAVVGNMGSRKRFNYTMMGDTVNLAARNESGAKTYGAFVMVTEETRSAAQLRKDEFVFRFLDRIVVKGRTQPVAVYELLGFRAGTPAATYMCLEFYQKGMERYERRDWEGAFRAFSEAARHEPWQPEPQQFVSTNPSLVMRERCRRFQEAPPPEDWDGLYVMKTK